MGRSELKYRHDPIPNDTPIILDEDSHHSAIRAEWTARKAGLGVTIFSYTDVLAQVTAGEDPITACARLTGTEYKEQLKALFASDAPLDGKHQPHAATAILSYSDKLDYHKLGVVLSTQLGEQVGSLRSAFSDLGRITLTPDYLGINQDSIEVPALVLPERGDTFEPYTDKFGSYRIIDTSIRSLKRICMLVGHKKADALMVVDGQNEQFGNRLDTFLKGYFGGALYAIADVRRTE